MLNNCQVCETPAVLCARAMEASQLAITMNMRQKKLGILWGLIAFNDNDKERYLKWLTVQPPLGLAGCNSLV